MKMILTNIKDILEKLRIKMETLGIEGLVLVKWINKLEKKRSESILKILL
jgi:hypothetical protein